MADAADKEALAVNRREQAALQRQLLELQDQEQALLARLAERARQRAPPPHAAEASDHWSKAFEWDEALRSLVRERFGHASFRPLQREVINACLSGVDAFAVLPTGAGKSLCFMAPGLLRPGLTVVVSPLVSLMQDQVDRLHAIGVRAALLAADLTDRAEATRIQSEAADPASSGLRFLYVTPERVAKSKQLLSKLQKCYLASQLSRFCIDEAHCCAAQGHDFRPDYLAMGVLRDSFPDVPILALTATASEQVRRSVQATLQMTAQTRVFRGHFDRANLRYSVLPKPADADGLLDAMAAVALRTHAGKPGIVYTLSRADAERVTAGLSQRGVRVATYHAGIETAQRRRVQSTWQRGGLQVVVATVAFGLGIDKADVRFVLHHTVSKSLEGYYQESGRAGRDGEPADVIAWWAPSDFFRLASLAAESRERDAALAQLRAAGEFCEDDGACRRQKLATLFGQPLQPRAAAAAAASCCDVCAAAAATAAAAAAAAGGAAAAGAGSGSAQRPAQAHVLPQVVGLLRLLQRKNQAAMEADATGGAAAAKLTCLKLVGEAGKAGVLPPLGAPAAPKLGRPELERLVLRLTLADALRIHFAFSAYSITPYLFVRPALQRLLREHAQPSEEALGLPASACRIAAAAAAAAQPAPRKRAKAAPAQAKAHDASSDDGPTSGAGSDADEFAQDARATKPGKRKLQPPPQPPLPPPPPPPPPQRGEDDAVIVIDSD